MRLLSRATPLSLLILTLLSFHAYAWDRSRATIFATLPPGTAHPEGITVDAVGNVYVTTFDVSKTSGPGDLIVFDSNGKLLRHVSVLGSTNLLLGPEFHPITGALLVIDFGAGKVLKVDPVTGISSVFTTVGPPPAHGLNDQTTDSAGNVYVSDSFQGTIWRIGPMGGTATAWVTHPLLTTKGFPAFGANGLAFNKEETAQFVANTGNRTIVKIPVVGGSPGTTGVPGTPEVFVNSVNGGDGLTIDDEDNIWVCANQADEIEVIDKTGRVIAKLGDFGGIDSKGAPIGLLFPASLVFSPTREFIYVTNLSLDLRIFGQQAVDSQWAAQVTTHTVSKIPAGIPPIRGLPESAACAPQGPWQCE